MRTGINRDLDLTAEKRRITRSRNNPFRPGSFHNDVGLGITRKAKDPELLRKLMSYQSLTGDIPNLRDTIKTCCNEVVTKKTED